MLAWKPIVDASELPALGTDESEFLDFKRDPWSGDEKGKAEQLRDVVQFANHLGGSLIVGADEDTSGRLHDFVPVPDAQGVASRLRDLCYARLSPRVEVDCVVLKIPSGSEVVVANVAPSVGPVAIKHGDKWEFYRRYGKSKKPIDFEEVEHMWTDGRRGKLMLLKIPTEKSADERRRVFVDATASDPAFLRGPCVLTLHDDRFELKLENQQTFGLPYEFVRAAWEGSEGQWFVSLTARFELRGSESTIRVGYSP